MAILDITSADTTVYPSENAIEVVAKEGSRGQEGTHTNALEEFVEDFVASGFTISDGGGLFVDVASGVALIQGHRIQLDATKTVALTPSATSNVYLVISRDGVDNVDKVELNATTGGAPANSIPLGEIVTNATIVTDSTDQRPLGPAKEGKVFGPALGIHLGSGTDVAAVNITRENLQGIDTKVLILADGSMSRNVAAGWDVSIRDNTAVLRTIGLSTTDTLIHAVSLHAFATLLGSVDHTIDLAFVNVSSKSFAFEVIALAKG